MSETDRQPGSEIESAEEYINAVTIGKREPLNSTIYLAPYDVNWPARFTEFASLIHKSLADQVLLLEHVGSTAVPGLSAKPIIDMVLAVADSADENNYVPPLVGNGFVLRVREPDWYEHRLLKAPAHAGNLHVFSIGCEEIDRMIAFRDCLRDNANDRRLYESRKRELAAQTWEFTQNYADAKADIIREILERAQR